MTKESISAIARKYKKHYGAECRQKHLEEWRGSGLSMNEYCHRHDLAISTLSKWNQRHGEPIGIKLKPLKPARISLPLLPSASLLEIRLPNGIQIRLGNAEDTMTFKKILEVIQSCN